VHSGLALVASIVVSLVAVGVARFVEDHGSGVPRTRSRELGGGRRRRRGRLRGLVVPAARSARARHSEPASSRGCRRRRSASTRRVHTPSVRWPVDELVSRPLTVFLRSSRRAARSIVAAGAVAGRPRAPRAARTGERDLSLKPSASSDQIWVTRRYLICRSPLVLLAFGVVANSRVDVARCSARGAGRVRRRSRGGNGRLPVVDCRVIAQHDRTTGDLNVVKDAWRLLGPHAAVVVLKTSARARWPAVIPQTCATSAARPVAVLGEAGSCRSELENLAAACGDGWHALGGRRRRGVDHVGAAVGEGRSTAGHCEPLLPRADAGPEAVRTTTAAATPTTGPDRHEQNRLVHEQSTNRRACVTDGSEQADLADALLDTEPEEERGQQKRGRHEKKLKYVK